MNIQGEWDQAQEASILHKEQLRNADSLLHGKAHQLVVQVQTVGLKTYTQLTLYKLNRLYLENTYIYTQLLLHMYICMCTCYTN